MAIVVKPPESFWDHEYPYHRAIFLGGSIEMGLATKWQARVAAALDDLSVLLLDPRRDDWDSGWLQDPTPGTKFHEQVTWELDAIEFADTHVFYFDSDTKSPITLMELGLQITSGYHPIVFCPKGFWRYGNVKIVCDRFGVRVHEDESEFIAELRGHC